MTEGSSSPRRTPAPSIVAASVNDDDDVHSVDAAIFVGNAGPASCGGEEQANAQDESVPMEEGPLPARPVRGESGERRCGDAGPVAPSVEAVSSGRWHYTADQCQCFLAILQERLSEHY